MLAALGAEVEGEDQPHRGEHALGVPVGEGVVEAVVEEGFGGRPGVGQDAGDEADPTDDAHREQERAQQPRQALGAHADGAEEGEGEQVQQRAVEGVERLRARVGPEHGEELPGGEQREAGEGDGERAPEALEGPPGERRAQDQRLGEDDGGKAGGVGEVAAGVEGLIDDGGGREQDERAQPDELPAATVDPEDGVPRRRKCGACRRLG